MEAIRAQLVGVADEYERLLTQLSHLQEENDRLKNVVPSGDVQARQLEVDASSGFTLRATHEHLEPIELELAQSGLPFEDAQMGDAVVQAPSGFTHASLHTLESSERVNMELAQTATVVTYPSIHTQERVMPLNLEETLSPRSTCTSARMNEASRRECGSILQSSTSIDAPVGRLRPQWDENSCQDAGTDLGCVVSSQNMRSSFRQDARLSSSVSQGDLRVDNSCLQSLVLEPTDFKRIVWVWISILAFTHDMILIPLAVFGSPKSRPFFLARACVASFWIMDMFASFFLGYYVEGRIEMRPRKVAAHYLKRFFLLDLFLVILDLADLLFWDKWVDTFTAFRVGMALRLARGLRVIRLIRLVKVLPALLRRTESIQSNVVRTLVNILQTIVAIIVLCHFLSCAWYGLATTDLLPTEWPTWVKQIEFDDAAVQARTLTYYYATALHWCFTQFTPGSMEVVPRNTFERVYNVLVLLLGLVMFSSLVSSVTNAMTKYRERNAEKFKQRDNLSEYLKINRVSLGLGNQIFDFLQHRGFSVTARPIDTDIPGLKKLPEKFRVKLYTEVHTPTLIAHPLFSYFEEVAKYSMQTICHMAMSQQIVMEGQRLFNLGERGSKMFFVTCGELEYTLGVSLLPTARIMTGDFISEAVLWAEWSHKGHVDADKVTEVAMLDAVVFGRVAQSTKILPYCKTYALTFYSKLLDMPPDELTDIGFSFEELFPNALFMSPWSSLKRDGRASSKNSGLMTQVLSGLSDS